MSFTTSGVFRIAAISLLSLSTIAFGVPAQEIFPGRCPD